MTNYRCIFLLAVATFLGSPARAADPERLDRKDLLQYHDSSGTVQPVVTPADWQLRREEILRGMRDVMGPLPGGERRVPLDVQLIEEVDAGSYIRRLITYQSELGSRTPAYLCIPKECLDGNRKAAAVLCLHPTDSKVGHKVVVGLGGRAGRQYAAELAQRGYVTLSPAYPHLANYWPNLGKLGYVSGTMKAIWDNSRGLDLLASLSFVDDSRGFAAIGHSLGGHNAIYTAVFDERVSVVVSSCGFDSYLQYYGGDEKNWNFGRGWCQIRYMPLLSNYRGKLDQIPFDFHELIAALAPRPLFVNSPLQDGNFRWQSVDECAAAALPVYRLLGRETDLTVKHPDRDHSFPEQQRQEAYSVIDQVLRPAGPSQRIPATEPADAVRTFETIDGFEMQLVASEPEVVEPIVISYDANGLMYVAEYLKFPASGGESNGPDGRIRLLRDDNGDGHYEHSTVFADNLAWPTGICPWKGGVFVIASPDLWYLKDCDGDGVADVRKKVFTGFGFTTDEGTANNLIWGLDHWVYGAGSQAGGEVRPADDPDARSVALRGHDFRFHPATGRFEATSGTEQFGNTFDDWGNRFLCQNSKPAVHVVLPARYLARNPYLPVASVRQNVWKGDEVFRASPPEPWRVARSKIRNAMDRKWAATYVSHDVFSAVTGVTIYRGAAYPPQYRGNLFIGEVQGNLLHRRVLRPLGVSFASERVDVETEIVRSTDNWFRPTNMTNAPDGTLHITDMYREVIETPDSLPEELLAKLDVSSGHDRGRIYRLAPSGFKPPPPPQLGSASTAALVRELANPNGWWRDTASRLLYERQDRGAVVMLRTMLRDSDSELAQLHAMYALEGLGALADEDLLGRISSRSARLRQHTVRLAESRLSHSTKLVASVVSLADDDDARVRFQVALSLGETGDPRASVALAKVARRDAGDRWMRTAVLSSSLKLAAGMLQSMLADADFASSSEGRLILRQLALVVGGRNRRSEVAAVLKLVESSPAGRSSDVRRTVILGLGEGLRRSASSLNRYVDESPATAELLVGLIESAKKTLAKTASTVKQRLPAIELLAHGSFDDVRDDLVAMLDSRQAPAVQLAAVKAMASFENSDVAKEMIDAWQGLSPGVRGEVIEALLGRREWTATLLAAIEDQQVAPGYISPVRKTRLVQHGDAKIRTHAGKLFSASAPGPRKSVVDEYRSALKLTGDATSGEKVFEKNCMTCHKAGGRGHDVGPNLATIQNRTPEALMIQILDPNREVLANHTQYIALLESGRVVTGLIASESPSSITLRRAENVQETILRQNIEEIIGSGKSLMPEGFEQAIDPQQMSDLLAFLLGLGK